MHAFFGSTHTKTHTHTGTYTQIYTYIHTYNTYMYMPAHTHTNTQTHTHTHTHPRARAQATYLYTDACRFQSAIIESLAQTISQSLANGCSNSVQVIQVPVPKDESATGEATRRFRCDVLGDLELGSPVVPFCPFFWVPLLKSSSRKKGTLIIKGLHWGT